MNHTERRLLMITSFGHFMSHYNMLVFPALVLPLSGVLNMDMAQVLGLSFWSYLLFGVTALPWGLAGDRVGGKPLMLVMFLGSGISGLAAAHYIDSPDALSICLAGVGLFSGVYHPIGMGLISKGAQRLSVAMGYNAVFGGLGLVVAPLMTGLVNWVSGPRAGFLLIGVLNLAGLALMALLPLDEPQVKERARPAGQTNMMWAFSILLVAMALAGIAFTGSTIVLPAYFELKSQRLIQELSASYGIGLSGNLLATTITSMVYLVGMAGQFIGGHVGERFEPRYSYLFFHAACIPAAAMMATAAGLELMGLAMVYFFFMLGMQAIENTLVARFSPPRFLHSAFGLKFIMTFGVGALAVKLVQWIKSWWGIEAVFTGLAVVSVLLVVSILGLIWQTSPKRTPVPVHSPIMRG